MRAIRRSIQAALFVAVWYFGWRFAAENSSVVSINFLAVQLEGIALWAALAGTFAGGVVAVGVIRNGPRGDIRKVSIHNICVRALLVRYLLKCY